jgi:hypothetical protein
MLRAHRPRAFVLMTLAAGILAGACSAGTAGTAAPTVSPPGAAPSAPAAPAPSAPAAPTAPSGGAPSSPGPVGGQELVVPKPGQLDVHPIAADSFAARVDGRHVILTISFTSGVEPCSILDTIVVQRGEGAFAITLRQGHGPGDQVCIMIAMLRKTQVDLGDLDPGTYTITDTMQGAAPIQVVVN